MIYELYVNTEVSLLNEFVFQNTDPNHNIYILHSQENNVYSLFPKKDNPIFNCALARDGVKKVITNPIQDSSSTYYLRCDVSCKKNEEGRLYFFSSKKERDISTRNELLNERLNDKNNSLYFKCKVCSDFTDFVSYSIK